MRFDVDNKIFEEALDDMITAYMVNTTPDEIISALELKLYAMREEHSGDDIE